MDAPPHLSSFSISVDSPCRDFCDKMLNDPSANNLRSLEDLSIKPSQLSLDDQERLATVLERAPNLRTLAALHLEEYYLGRDGSPLADAIAALSNLHALELRDVGEEGFELCRRLSCRPGTVRLKGQILIEMDDLQGTMVHFAVDRTALLGLPVFQRASTVVLDGFSFLPEDGPPSQSLEAGMEPWSDTRTLSLTNMDPLAVVAACPNLTHLSLGYFCPEDDHFEEFIHDREFPWSTDTLGDALGTRLQSLDVYVDTEQAIPPRAVSVTIRATRPIVLSVRFPAEAVALWEDLARMLQDAGSRTRYLDVVLLRGDQPRGHSLTIRGRPIGVPRTSPQQWLEKCLPLFASCGLLCVRLCLAGQTPFGKITSAEYDKLVARGADPLDGRGWDEIREAAPKMIARALPSLRYVAVASGYMVEDLAAPRGAAFAGETRWWAVKVGGGGHVFEIDSGAPQLVEVDSAEGARIDSYMRGESFANTLQFPSPSSELNG